MLCIVASAARAVAQLDSLGGIEKHTMKIIAQVFGVAVLLFTFGCSTVKVPQGAHLVGGGLQIDWQAPEDRTVILIEETTGRTVATKSLSKGDPFTFDVTTDGDKRLLREAFDEMPSDAKFVIYFVPAPKVHKDAT